MVETMALTVMAGHSPSKDGRSSERPMPGVRVSNHITGSHSITLRLAPYFL
jgi:hypothetical protein